LDYTWLALAQWPVSFLGCDKILFAPFALQSKTKQTAKL
jgi:hypothetical protein